MSEKQGNKKVAVVVLNWNGQELLAQLLPALIQNTNLEMADLIVADNGSTDDSLQLLKTQFPQIGIIDLKKNYGFAEGYNRALDQISHPYTVLLNSDVEVAPYWLEPLVEQLEQSEKAVACQPKILDYYKKTHFEYAGASGGYIDFLAYPFCRGRLFDELEEDQGQYDDVRSVFWASGACFCIKTEVYKEVGGLDNLFFAHMEEIDLCWRLKSRAYDILCVPQSTVYHMGGGTLSKMNPKKTFLNFRNNLFLIYKNVHSFRFLKIFIARLVLDGVAGFYHLISGQPQHCWAILKAHWAFYTHFTQFRQQAKINKAKTSVKNIQDIYPQSIVLNYFLKKITKFSQLKWF